MAVTEGGIIGKQNPSTITSASGAWRLNEAFLRVVGGDWPNFNAPSSVAYNVLGGGSGGNNQPGSNFSGGGAGGGAGALLVQGTFSPQATVTYAVTIGAGGSIGGSGGTSSFSSFASSAGGQNGSPLNRGGSNATYSGGTGNGNRTGGGGAGAGGNGANAYLDQRGGNGGTGVAMPVHPTQLRAGGGGAGGVAQAFFVAFGTATDGGGLYGWGNSTPGATNRGAGGGGVASGGSGRVILRYADSFPAATATTGSPTVTVSGGYRHYDFTGSGSITF